MSDMEDSRRWRIRLPDVLVGIVLAVMLVGLVIPWTYHSRIAANRVKCANNLRQVIMATQNIVTTHKELPPLFGSAYGRGNLFNGCPAVIPSLVAGTYRPGATIWFYLLPYMYQYAIYDRDPCGFDDKARGPVIYLSTAQVDDDGQGARIPEYLCPSDSSLPVTGFFAFTPAQLGNQVSIATWDGKNRPQTDPPDKSRPWGALSYAANWMVFSALPRPRRLDDVVDGTSNTIFFTEKMAVCDNLPELLGGNLWAMPPFFTSGTHEQPPVVNYAGVFGFTGILSDGSPTTASYNGALFQTEPKPHACDPRLATSPHAGGINVAMGDGSVKFVSDTISQNCWQAALTPRPVAGFSEGYPRSDILGNDWSD